MRAGFYPAGGDEADINPVFTLTLILPPSRERKFKNMLFRKIECYLVPGLRGLKDGRSIKLVSGPGQ
jgi:hypothetical protein